MRTTFPKMVRLLRPAEQGEAKIDHITVTPKEARFGNLSAMFSGGGGIMDVEPGRYARLIVGGELMMTDTQMEQRSNSEVVARAQGHVLIAGLGLGMILHPILAKPEVTHVTVLEQSQDVIDLVAPSLAKYGNRLTIIQTDAFTWPLPKGATWDTIYFDIWPRICDDNLPEAARLSRHYSRRLNRANPRAWMGGWMLAYLRARRR